MRKILNNIITLMLILSMYNTLSVGIYAIDTPLSEETVVDNLTTAISQFYYNKDVTGNNMENAMFSVDVADYLSEKL